ncbi:MAG TPA: pitrilysin family protein, partial [Thermoanaerobaculia bacterium]|nr:pitrilysin family protein [Thermoanaerobaculia bacterium]
MLAIALLLALSALAEQTAPPPPGPPRPLNIPSPTDKTLANGLRVIVIPKSGVPLVAARLLVKTGGEADPADKAGLADMTASLLTKGTTTKSAEEIARGVEALGASIESGAGWDNSYVAISSLANNFGEAMTYVADVVRNPTFKADEVDRLREQNIDALSVNLKDPAQLARFVANRVVYGGGPYGHNLGGTPKSLESVKPEDAAAFHAKWYRPDNAIFVVAGTITPDAAIAIAEKSFGDWKASGPMPESVGGAGATQSQEKPRVVVIDMPDAGQAAVMVTRRGLARTDPAYITSQVT